MNWAMEHPEITQAIVNAVLTRNPNRPIGAVLLTDKRFRERMLVMQMWADGLTETMGPVAPQ